MRRVAHATVGLFAAAAVAAAAAGHIEEPFEIVGKGQSIGFAEKLARVVALRLFREVVLRMCWWRV
jgi:hypothetical protein